MNIIRGWARSLLVAAVAAALMPIGGAPAQAAYPGEDGRIAFVRANQVYTMGAGGESVTRLTSSGRNNRPEWSPDGRRISYIHVAADGRRDVWIMNAGGGGKRAITTTGDVTSAGASWSPDGQTLAYAAGGVLQLVSIAPGSTPTAPSGFETNSFCDAELAAISVDKYLAWSPDGRIALFNRSDCRYDWAIWWFYPATGELYQHMGGGADCCGYDHWTDLFFGPTGEFGYTNEEGGDYGETYEPLVIVYPGFESRPYDFGGAPSPSGRYMAFSKRSTGVSFVMRADIDGTDRRRLARGYQPDWQPRC